MNQPTREEQVSGVQFGKYQVFAKIATGGMAEIYLAKQQGFAGINKTVVIKCILPHLTAGDDFVQMFLDEARIASHLQHPNIVQIFEIGQLEQVYFIAMEYIRGVDLKRLRKKLFADEAFRKEVPYGFLAGIMAQAAAGLHYAHHAVDEEGKPLNVIHRDVSPNNMLVSYNGTVKIVDFGVAKATTQEHRTRAGMLKGRLSYMSPEQISGQKLTPASDVFALGIVLYELSTNQRLFKRQNDGETIQAVLHHPIPPPSQVAPGFPYELEQIIMKALEREPAHRYTSADQMRQDLEAFMQKTGHHGPVQIAQILDKLFDEEKKQAASGVLPGGYSQADLQYLAYRAGAQAGHTSGSYGSFSSHSRSSAPPPPPPPQDRASGSVSFGYFHDDMAEGPPPSKSRLGLGLALAFVFLLGGGAALAWQMGLFESASSKRPSPPKLSAGHQKIEQTKLKNLIEKHQAQINQFLIDKAFSKAHAYLHAVSESPERPKLDSWLQETKQLIQLESKLASVALFFRNKSYAEAEVLLKKLLVEAPDNERVRELYEKLQTERKADATPPPREVEPTPPRDEPEPRALKKVKGGKKHKKPKKTKVAAIAPPQRDTPPPPRDEPKPPAVREMGSLFINSTPTGRVEIDGQLIGYSPINGKSIQTGIYNISISRSGFVTEKRQIRIAADQPYEVNVALRPVATRIAPPPPPPRETQPPPPPSSEEPTAPKAAFHFSSARIPKQARVRLLISDTRGIISNQPTQEHPKLAKTIEAEAARLLGSSFSTKDVTLSWQTFVRQQAVKEETQRATFYPRAVAFVIYRELLRGRSKSRVSQLLVLYQRKDRFRDLHIP